MQDPSLLMKLYGFTSERMPQQEAASLVNHRSYFPPVLAAAIGHMGHTLYSNTLASVVSYLESAVSKLLPQTWGVFAAVILRQNGLTQHHLSRDLIDDEITDLSSGVFSDLTRTSSIAALRVDVLI